MAHTQQAKPGAVGLTKSLGKERALTGVLVNAIAPAVFETPILGTLTQMSWKL